MKTTPRNTMIKSEDEIQKDSSNVPLGTQVHSWYFPVEKETIVAETYAEALEIINKRKEK